MPLLLTHLLIFYKSYQFLMMGNKRYVWEIIREQVYIAWVILLCLVVNRRHVEACVHNACCTGLSLCGISK